MIAGIPPLPFGFDATDYGHVYLLDANGRKIASLWGRPDEKIALAELVIEASRRLYETRRVHALAEMGDEGQ